MIQTHQPDYQRLVQRIQAEVERGYNITLDPVTGEATPEALAQLRVDVRGWDPSLSRRRRWLAEAVRETIPLV